MPIASNNTGIMSRRQSFNGKGLTFIEVIFDNAITATATTPDTKDSTFQKVRDAVLGGVVSGTTLLAQSYRLAAKATDDDASEAAAIDADDSIDSYQFIVEGSPDAIQTADSTGSPNAGVAVATQTADDTATLISSAEADLEADILSRIDVSDSAGNVHVKIRFLPSDGVGSSGGSAVYGMFDQRGDA
jgi:hypothetical protein|tara:strand:- start:271 stop:834 length:564 start_codon:yes stop_codon:yes gene_type:complete